MTKTIELRQKNRVLYTLFNLTQRDEIEKPKKKVKKLIVKEEEEKDIINDLTKTIISRQKIRMLDYIKPLNDLTKTFESRQKNRRENIKGLSKIIKLNKILFYF